MINTCKIEMLLIKMKKKAVLDSVFKRESGNIHSAIVSWRVDLCCLLRQGGCGNT